MIKLQNVSKFYHSNGTIATGFSKVSIEFNMGEFVAITGESGSGKSTLLNVISGLDTYEEGELYINGLETSHYTEKDFEEYRRKYIGNIFQSFNLINSYTVYQNVELVMLLNGYKKKEVKEKVNSLINQVNLTEYKNTKVSKLSGGQKQRVAIARALAKETPIIIADEPTGNLDVKAAKEVFETLSQISKDKLVIIVTHNYEQVEEYVTRKIKMHDGKIVEDLRMKPKADVVDEAPKDYKSLSFLNTLKLGLRNTFNIIPKFILLLMVFIFISLSLLSEYSSFKEEEYYSQFDGYNYLFNNDATNRIILKKEDGSVFTEEDYNQIANLANIQSIVKTDLSLDQQSEFYASSKEGEDYYYSIYGSVKPISELAAEDITYGQYPTGPYDMVVEMNPDYNYLDPELLNYIFYGVDSNYDIDKSIEYHVTGLVETEEESWQATIYLSDGAYKQMLYAINQRYSALKVNFNGQIFQTSIGDGYGYNLVGTDFVPEGTAYISTNFNQYSSTKKAVGQAIEVTVGNIYYTDTVGLTVSQTFDETNCLKLLNVKKENLRPENIYINQNDLDRLFNKGNYQSSVMVEDVHKIEATATELKDLGYSVLVMKDSLYTYGAFSELLRVFKTFVTILLVCVLFFISYFVIRIIFRSRNVYFSTIRMLGASQSVARNLLIVEMLVVANIAEVLCLGAIYGQTKGYYEIDLFDTMIQYLTTSDHILLYILPIVLAFLIAIRYANRLFVNSAMVTIKEDQ